MKLPRIKLQHLLVLEIVSLAVLFINESFLKNVNDTVYIIILTIGVTLSTNVLAAYISDKYKNNDLAEIAANNFEVLKSCQEYGLINIQKGFPLDNELIKNDFINSKNVYIVMNDAKRFISDNTLLLEQRIKKKNLSTTLILQDLNQTDIMDALTRKNGHGENPNYYKEKIRDVIDYHIKKLRDMCNNKHKFSFYLNPNYNTLAIILTDNYAMYSIYRIAPGKTEVPHFIFKQGCHEYNLVKRDIDNIIAISEIQE